MVPYKVTCYLVLGKPGKHKVYHGPTFVAPGFKAYYVTPHTLACTVRRVTNISSLSLINRGVRLVHHSTLRVLGFQARINLIAVHITASSTITKTYKFHSSNTYQPSVEVELHSLSGLRSRSTQAPDLVSRRPRHFTLSRGYNLIVNIHIDTATFSHGYSTLRCANSVIVMVTNTPNGVNVTKYCYGCAHARHDAIG